MTSSKRRKALPSTPPTVNTIGVREFMRGGIDSLDKPTVVMSHNDEKGMWIPRGQYEAVLGVNGTYYASSSMSPTTDAVAAGNTTLTSGVMRGFQGHVLGTFTPETPESRVDAAVKTLRDYLSSLPEQADNKEDK